MKKDHGKRKMDNNLPPLYPFPATTSNNVPNQNAQINLDSNDPMLMFDDNAPNMELPRLPSSISQLTPTPSVDVINQAQFDDEFNDILNYDILSDPYLLEVINEPIENVCGHYVGESSSTGQRIAQENVWKDFGNPMKLSVWPVSPQPYVCSCCQLLREIKFYNGKHVRNLEVHGLVGTVCHAILDKFDYDNISSENHEYLMFDLGSESIQGVRNFLFKYCEQCKNEGYTLAPDPLSRFYQTLCIGLDENVASDYNAPMDSGDLNPNPNQQDYVRNNGKDIATDSSQGAMQERSFLAAQRERTGKLTLGDFSDYFHLPMTDASRMMNVCSTVIKKKCRAGGMTRWPHRKIKGIRNKILKKKEDLKRATFEEKMNILAEIQILEQELVMAIGKQ